MRAAIKSDPEFVKAYDQLGKMLLQQGKAEEGREALATAKRLQSDLSSND